MTESEEIKAIEVKLKIRRITVQTFRLDAKVSASTWHRIKNEATIPNGATMRRIRDAMAKIEEEKRGAKD